MASPTSKRWLFRALAGLGAVILVVGIVMFMMASRQVAPVTLSSDGTAASGTFQARNADISVTVSTSCDATADASGAWQCQIAAAAPGADVAATIPDPADSNSTVDVDDVALSADGQTVSGTTTPGAAVSAVVSAECDTTSDSHGAWSCTLVAVPGGDVSGWAEFSVLSSGLGLAAVVLICLGALAAIVGGIGMIATGGRPIGLISLLLIPVGVALDFALAALNNLLKLPLFLDSVGHILAGMLGGPVIGGITGWLGVMTNSTFQPNAVVWSFQGATIGVLVGLLAQGGMFKNIGRSVVSTVIVIATSATLSSVISMVVYGGIDGYTISFIRAILVRLGWSMTSAVVVTSVIIELIDKTISVGLPVLVIMLLSNRVLSLFVTGTKLRDMRTEQVTDSASAAELAEAAVATTADGYGSYEEKDDGDAGDSPA